VEYNEDKVRKITSEILAAINNLEDLQKLPEKSLSLMLTK